MKRILSAAVITLLLSGCNRTLVDEFRNGLPKKEMVEVKTPGNDSTAPVRSQGSALQGDRSDSYRMTRAATVTVNGATLSVLGLIKAITDHRPTTIDENQAVWGPSVPEALEPHIYRLTVTKSAEGAFSYALEGKDKTLGDDAYVILISGNHQATATEGRGSGSFLLDFDAAQTLPEHDALVGAVTVDYARADETDVITVAAEFDNVNDGHGGRDDFSYRYSKTPGTGGTFDFLTREDIHHDPAMSLPEKLTVRSRWNEQGAGRSDYQVTEGNLSSAVTGNECWDTSFDSQYLNASWNPSANYGDEASACAFTPAEYSSL
ncbi:MAG: membrane lipoprotein lipid attachment site-containing protein [Myxococcota bacterium]|nr:membrane lipoprotein lipid attachment site-containing protein [Myxococcota bacterium]